MNLRKALGALAVVGLIGAGANAAVAQNMSLSNQNVHNVAASIGTAITSLEKDQRDFDGHRVRGIEHLRGAYRQLRLSVGWARNHGYGYYDGIPPAPPAYNGPLYGQGTSDQEIVDVTRAIPGWIAQLQGDARDYGGHRITAMNQLQAAENELNLAIQYFRAHNGY
ncbi:MAG: hypothetical protein JO060_03770 [Candidatus Eremiobacteraeota bacterium]|nr:hypothetical protein [Candidatus Eremiobacteraeota bacterium]MBV9647862.1 hypothetical protein [Candidatus Eremiobacteraeota bacterium]